MANCQLCEIDFVTPVYHSGARVHVYECDSCGKPMVTLEKHVEEPSLETEAYALGVVRGLFGPGAAFRVCEHPIPANHWSAHLDIPTG